MSKPKFSLTQIRKIVGIKDIGYSQSYNQFTSYSADRQLLQDLLIRYEALSGALEFIAQGPTYGLTCDEAYEYQKIAQEALDTQAESKGEK